MLLRFFLQLNLSYADTKGTEQGVLMKEVSILERSYHDVTFNFIDSFVYLFISLQKNSAQMPFLLVTTLVAALLRALLAEEQQLPFPVQEVGEAQGPSTQRVPVQQRDPWD